MRHLCRDAVITGTAVMLATVVGLLLPRPMEGLRFDLDNVGVAAGLDEEGNIACLATYTDTGDRLYTSAHVASGWTGWARLTANGYELLPIPVTDPSRDLAWVDLGRPRVIEFARPILGETIFVIGYPVFGGAVGRGLNGPVVTKGIVSCLGRGWFMFDALSAPGSSGSAIVNTKGQLLGILSGVWDSGHGVAAMVED